MAILAILIQHNFGNPSHSNQRRKRNKRNPNCKRRRRTVMVSNDMMLYIEHSKHATRKLLELTDEFNKTAGYRINTHKLLHFYTLTKKD